MLCFSIFFFFSYSCLLERWRHIRSEAFYSIKREKNLQSKTEDGTLLDNVGGHWEETFWGGLDSIHMVLGLHISFGKGTY